MMTDKKAGTGIDTILDRIRAASDEYLAGKGPLNDPNTAPIKGVVFLDEHDQILSGYDLSEEMRAQYDLPVLSSDEFNFLYIVGEPFSILRIVVKDAKIISADLLLNMTPNYPKPTQSESPTIDITFTGIKE